MIRFLESRGFSVVRIRGSHHILVRDEVRTTVPVHGGKTLKIGTLRGILRDIELSHRIRRALEVGPVLAVRIKPMKRKAAETLSYRVFYEEASEGGYVAFVPALPGYLESLAAHGEPIPV